MVSPGDLVTSVQLAICRCAAGACSPTHPRQAADSCARAAWGAAAIRTAEPSVMRIGNARTRSLHRGAARPTAEYPLGLAGDNGARLIIRLRPTFARAATT